MRRVITVTPASGTPPSTQLRSAAMSPMPEDPVPAETRTRGRVSGGATGPGRGTGWSRSEQWDAFAGGSRDLFGGGGGAARGWPGALEGARATPPRVPDHRRPRDQNEPLAIEEDSKPYTIVIDGEVHTRPQTRGECAGGARPCPWVSCRYHLLIEASAPRAGHRATVLRMTRETGRRVGRPAGLAATTPGEIVERWIASAVESLALMAHTCQLDVTDENPDGLDGRRAGALIGVTRQVVDAEMGKPRVVEALAVLRGYL